MTPTTQKEAKLICNQVYKDICCTLLFILYSRIDTLVNVNIHKYFCIIWWQWDFWYCQSKVSVQQTLKWLSLELSLCAWSWMKRYNWNPPTSSSKSLKKVPVGSGLSGGVRHAVPLVPRADRCFARAKPLHVGSALSDLPLLPKPFKNNSFAGHWLAQEKPPISARLW